MGFTLQDNISQCNAPCNTLAAPLIGHKHEGPIEILYRVAAFYNQINFDIGENEWSKERQLQGITDYALEFAKGTDTSNHTTSTGEQGIRKCLAEAATLYKIRVDAGKTKKSVRRILSNAKQWPFVLINEDGLLWQSDEDFQLVRTSFLWRIKVVEGVSYSVLHCEMLSWSVYPPPSASSIDLWLLENLEFIIIYFVFLYTKHHNTSNRDRFESIIKVEAMPKKTF